MSSQSPWLDLPIPITELILGLLPLSDYIRFSSVCKKWHLIQKHHRIRHSPFPPHMQVSTPWMAFISTTERMKFVLGYSPCEPKCHFLSFPETISNTLWFNASHGWFFLSDTPFPKRISCFNPVSKSQIFLPPLTHGIGDKFFGVCSASPLSMDCVVLIFDFYYSATAYLCRVGHKQSEWTLLDLPQSNGIWQPSYYNTSGVYLDGKFYCIGWHFFVIDSILAAPTVHILNMDCSQFLFSEDPENRVCPKLVESDGEILLVVWVRNKKNVSRFEVFKADFIKVMWVRMESIGDRALFVTAKSSLCLLASDVGCKSNCVYFMEPDDSHFLIGSAELSVFDLDIMCTSDGSPFPYKNVKWSAGDAYWFLPSLDYSI